MSPCADLVPLILAAHDHWWPRDLAVLSAVSCAWLFYARKRLYARPAVHSFRAAALLARALSENPSLASLVTGISICPVSPTRPKLSEWKAVRQLLALEDLAYIHLGGDLSANAERFLRYIAYPETLQELHIDGSLLDGRLTARASLEWDDSLALAFPALRKLRLASLDLDVCPPVAPYSSALVSLVMEHVSIVGGDLLSLVPQQRLEHLHVATGHTACFDEEIRLVLASCAVGCLHYDTRAHNNRRSFRNRW